MKNCGIYLYGKRYEWHFNNNTIDDEFIDFVNDIKKLLDIQYEFYTKTNRSMTKEEMFVNYEGDYSLVEKYMYQTSKGYMVPNAMLILDDIEKLKKECELPIVDAAGIYKITNKATGKAYIGSSNNIYRRWQDHIFLSKKNDDSSELYKDFNKICDWKFEIIKKMSKDASTKELINEEAKAIKEYKGELYNVINPVKNIRTVEEVLRDEIKRLQKENASLREEIALLKKGEMKEQSESNKQTTKHKKIKVIEAETELLDLVDNLEKILDMK